MANSHLTSNSSAQKHVVVVGGGLSPEREISLASASSVRQALNNIGYRVSFIDMDTDVAIKLLTLKPDVVFNCLHGIFGEDGCLPGLLNIMKLPYTHSGVFASSLAFNKIKAKEWFRLIGIATAESIVIDKNDGTRKPGDPMDRPYIIKPCANGSSIGVKAIFEGDHFDFTNYTFPYGDKILVERFIKGKEFTVAVLNGEALGIGELHLFKSKRFIDYEAKYSEGFPTFSCPASISNIVQTELLASSEKIYKSMDCRGPARIDFILEEESEKLFVLEINTHPGMRSTSFFRRIAETCGGINMECIVDKILKSANCNFE